MNVYVHHHNKYEPHRQEQSPGKRAFSHGSGKGGGVGTAYEGEKGTFCFSDSDTGDGGPINPIE